MVLALGLPLLARAGESWDIAALMQALARVQTLESKFIEQRESLYLTRPLTISGTLSYRAPRYLEKHSLAPIEERFIADGDKLSIERMRDGKATRHRLNLLDYPQLRPFIEGVRATLAGDLATLERFYTVALTGAASAWQLRLLPREASLRERIQEVRIQGQDTRIRAIEIHETAGDTSRMRITER